MKSSPLFQPEDLPPGIRYEKLFNHLPFMEQTNKVRGRPPFSKNAILRSLIYRNLRGLPSLGDLAFELKNNPMMAEVLGFSPFERSPSKERFSRFLRTTINQDLQRIRQGLVRTLKDEQVISGHIIALDSSVIEANVKENNLKTSVKDRFDKFRRLKGDPDARLSVKIHYPKPFQRKIEFFWGYRNHMINDTKSELPIHEVTYPADHDEKKIAVPMLKKITSQFPVSHVLGDANYDTEDILEYVVSEMKAQPVIPLNPRRRQKDSFQIKKDTVLCPANLKMHRKGRMKNNNRVYLQYSCPLYWGKKYKGQYLSCPIGHPKFFKQKGCNYLMRLSPSVRDTIAYGSLRFKKIYNQRSSVERIFSRLLVLSMHKPTVVRLQATQNHCTIAHITVLLVALAAHRMGFSDKIRYVKSFLPRFA
ncbi:MAG: transposase [Candidatus Aminicenantes bacterium]|nr:transposase [Candidatus Aminicenantes bacterium]